MIGIIEVNYTINDRKVRSVFGGAESVQEIRRRLLTMGAKNITFVTR